MNQPVPPTLQELTTYQCWVDHMDMINANNISALVKWARFAVENPSMAVVREVVEVVEKVVTVVEKQVKVQLLHTQDEKDAYELGRLEGLKQAEDTVVMSFFGSPEQSSTLRDLLAAKESDHLPIPTRLDRLRIVLDRLLRAASRIPRTKDQHGAALVDCLEQARRCLQDEGVSLTDGWETVK